MHVNPNFILQHPTLPKNLPACSQRQNPPTETFAAGLVEKVKFELLIILNTEAFFFADRFFFPST